MVDFEAALPPYTSRPIERAFFTVDELGDHVSRTRDTASRFEAPLGSLRVAPGADGLVVEVPGAAQPLALTHLTAQQLCNRLGVTTRFLESVSPETASLALNECLDRTPWRENTVLVRSKDQGERLHSLVSADYAEAWDADIIDAIARPLTAAGWIVPPYRALGSWRARPARPDEVLPGVPGYFGAVRAGDLIEPKGARSSDRNMHLFLVHPERVVDTHGVMGRQVFRGLTLRHSETGDGALRVEGFLFDFMCGNYMMYGSRQVFRLWMRHRGRPGLDFVQAARSRMEHAARRLAEGDAHLGRVARQAARVELSDDLERRAVEVQLMLMEAGAGRVFSQTFIRAALRLALGGRYGADNTLWAAASGLTEQAQFQTRYADRRALYDQAAARLLDWGVVHA